MRLPGKRRLRSPKLVLHPRNPRPDEMPAKAEEAEAPADPEPEPTPPPAAPPPADPPATESAGDEPTGGEPTGDEPTGGESASSGEEGAAEPPKWSARMRKDELRAVAEGIGIEVQDDWTKDQIIEALEGASS